MDKTEYQIKLEQITTLTDKGDYEAALEVVETIDWRRVKSVRTLCMVADIYEENDMLEDCKRILMLAYKRSSIGKVILYRLVEVSIKMGELDEAVDYYTEFVQTAPGDNSKYILKYKIYRAKRSPLEDQIAVLEEYKEKEYTERWAYELAQLYHKAGMKEKCVQECDDLILWFSEGVFVMKAMELKMRYQALTPSQQKKYNSRNVQKEPIVVPEIAEDVIQKQTEAILEKLGNAEAEVALSAEKAEAAAAEAAIAVDHPERPLSEGLAVEPEVLKERLASSLRDVFAGISKGKEEVKMNFQPPVEEEILETGEEHFDYHSVKELEPEDLESSHVVSSEKLHEYDIQRKVREEEAKKAAEEAAAREAAVAEAEKELQKEILAIPSDEMAPIVPEDPILDVTEVKRAETEQTETVVEDKDDPLAAIKRALEAALGEEVGIPMGEETKTEEISKEETSKEETSKEETSETEASEVESSESETSEPELSDSKVEEHPSEESTEDLISRLLEASANQMAEEVAEEEKRERERREREDREFLKSEGLFLEEEEEAEQKEEIESETRELLKPEQSESEQSNLEAAKLEKSLEKNIIAQVFDALRIDDIDEEEEEEAPQVKDAVEEREAKKPAESELTSDTKVFKSKDLSQIQDALSAKADELKPEDKTQILRGEELFQIRKSQIEEKAIAEEGESVFEELSEVSEEYQEEKTGLDNTAELSDFFAEDDDVFDESIKGVKEEFEETEKEESEDESWEEPEAESESEPESSDSEEVEEPPEEEGLEEEVEEEHVPEQEMPEEIRARILSDTRPEKLSGPQKKIFSYFAKVPGMDHQILDALHGVYMNAGDLTSKHGNIAVMGSQGSGKSRLLDGLVMAICNDLGLKAARMAKISGSALNSKNPEEAVKKLSGGFLIIEGAGLMAEDTIQKLDRAMEKRTDGLIVLIEDNKYDMRKLLAEYPSFADKFSTVISIPVFTNDELVTFARTYAQESGYKIDDMAVLALYTRIGESQTDEMPMTVSSVKDLVDKAILKAHKGKIQKKVPKKRIDSEGRIIIREKDFNF